MRETNSSKFIWLLAGTIIGSAVSLSFDEWIKPLFRAKAEIRISAESDQSGTANFIIQNIGKAVASKVSITLWATAPLAARTDITKFEHSGGVNDANCSVGFYEARLMGPGKSAVPSSLNTQSTALLIQCEQIRHREAWQGRLEYQGPEAVFGLLALIKDSMISEIKYARFADGL